MEKTLFDKLPCGSEVYSYSIKNGDLEAVILNYGGILKSLKFRGNEMVYSYETISGYIENKSNYLCSLVGRTANRIKGDSFTLNGKEYKIAKNDGGINHLHGGEVGFNQKIWNISDYRENALVLTYRSPDGEEGYPGNLDVTVTYEIIDNALSIHYEGISDADTYFGMTHHAYFNIGGLGSDLYEQILEVPADNYTEVDATLIPTGNRPSVESTPFDYRTPTRIGDNVTSDVSFYDHNFILNGKKQNFDGSEYNVAAVISTPIANLTALTTMPCMQIYSGSTTLGTSEKVKYSSICLETQYEPDAPHRGESLLKAGEKHDSRTIYIFR